MIPGNTAPRAIHIKIARTEAEIRACKGLIAENWKRNYDVNFSEEDFNLDKYTEKYPDAFAMGIVDEELVITGGLYIHENYTERFGGVTKKEIDEKLIKLGLRWKFNSSLAREYTKLAIRPSWEGKGIGKIMHMAIFNRNFLNYGSKLEHFYVLCAKDKIFNALYAPHNLRTHYLKPFPYYDIHNLYRTREDSFESRMVIPSVDAPSFWYELEYDKTYEVDHLRSHLKDLREDQLIDSADGRGEGTNGLENGFG
jgi:hypothetical protein